MEAVKEARNVVHGLPHLWCAYVYTYTEPNMSVYVCFFGFGTAVGGRVSSGSHHIYLYIYICTRHACTHARRRPVGGRHRMSVRRVCGPKSIERYGIRLLGCEVDQAARYDQPVRYI